MGTQFQYKEREDITIIVKPSVSGRPPIAIEGTGTTPINATSTAAEIIAFHYVNTTAGIGRVDIFDGAPQGTTNLKLTLGSNANGGNDDFSPSQPILFRVKVVIVFTTGTGILTIHLN